MEQLVVDYGKNGSRRWRNIESQGFLNEVVHVPKQDTGDFLGISGYWSVERRINILAFQF